MKIAQNKMKSTSIMSQILNRSQFIPLFQHAYAASCKRERNKLTCKFSRQNFVNTIFLKKIYSYVMKKGNFKWLVTSYWYPFNTWVEKGKCRLMSSQRTLVLQLDSNSEPCGPQPDEISLYSIRGVPWPHCVKNNLDCGVNFSLW